MTSTSFWMYQYLELFLDIHLEQEKISSVCLPKHPKVGEIENVPFYFHSEYTHKHTHTHTHTHISLQYVSVSFKITPAQMNN